MHSKNRHPLFRLFILIIVGLALPVWVTTLEARSSAAEPDIPRVPFAGRRMKNAGAATESFRNHDNQIDAPRRS